MSPAGQGGDVSEICVQDPRYYVLLEMEKGEDEAEKLVCECLTCTMWTV